MKKIIYYIIFTFASLISFSCNDSFEPKSIFVERYILNCVINGDSLLQLASLSKSYDVEGFDPYTNTVDPFIKNALVYFKYKGVDYQMSDTAIARTDTSRYKGPINVYSLKTITPVANDSIEITAIPSDGITLRAKTKVPARARVIVSQTTVFDKQTDLTFTWGTGDGDIYYLPRLKVYYTIRNEFPNKLYFVEVPLSFDDKGKPLYPLISKVAHIYFGPDMLDKTILNISENGEIADYKIVSCEFELKIFDEILSNYISSTNVYYEDLSIRLDEPTYSNVQGGTGIVGSSLKVYKELLLSSIYIQALGYTP